MHFKRYSEHTSTEIVSFSRVMAVAFTVIAAVVFWLKDWELTQSTMILAGVGVSFGLLGVVAPSTLRPLNHIWMSFAFVMNFVMTRVILSFIYFVLVAPISIIMRLLGKAVVVNSAKEASYWAKYKAQAPAKHFEHLYTLSEIEMGNNPSLIEPVKVESV